jgi:hypothetical protein
MIAEKEINLYQSHNNHLDYYKIISVFFTYNPKTKRASEGDSCRELFYKRLNVRVGFVGYTACHAPIERINKFFQFIHKRLGLSEMTFYSTNRTNVILLKIDKWWLSSQVKRQVFTMLLRCACDHYNYGTLNEAMSRYKYFKDKNVLNAVNYFLAGHTVLKSNRMFVDNNTECNYGFSDLFSRVEKYELPKFLQSN